MTITTLYLVHPAEDRKVEEVKAEMRELGPPAICVVDCGDYYMAIEGCHRLMAAAELGIAPVLKVFAHDDPIQVDILDTDYFKPGETKAAGEIAGAYRDRHNPVMTINPDGTLTSVQALIIEEE